MEHLDKPLAGALVTRYPRSVAKGSEGYVPNWGRPENSETGAAEGSLIEHLRILRRHKGPIFLVSLTGLILGIAVSVAMKPVYRARTSLEVLNINQDFMNMKQANPVSTEDNSYDTSEEQTQAKLLEGVALQRRVLSKLDPARPGTVENPQMATAGWRSWFQLSQPVPVTERERLLGKLTASLKVRPVARTRVLEVSAESTDPRLAAQFVNTLLEEFIQQNVEARLNSGERTGDWLHHEINEARSNLQRAEDALQDYARKSGLIFTDDTTNVETEKLQQLQQQLSSATADRIAKQSHFELAKNSPTDALGDILNDNVVRDTSAKMLDLRRQVASLGAVFNPGYSKLEQAQAELATIEASFQRERTDILRRIENDYVESADKEKMLAAAYDGQVRDVTGQGEKLIQYNILKREADSSRQLYDTMLQQTKQASIATAMRASSVRVVDPAEVPSRPFSPSFRMNAAIGLFCGCFLSVVLFTMRERADRTLQQPGHIKLWTEMTELGTIPAASFVKLGYGSADNTPDDQTAAVGRRALRFRGEPSEVELMTSRRGSSILAEAFRCTLTSILFVGENGSRPRVLVFTSASPGDGKTTTVSNLALPQQRFDAKSWSLTQISGVRECITFSTLIIKSVSAIS